MADLEIRDLYVEREGSLILKGVSLSLSRGEIHALMGPNGSGKSTLAQSIMGHPAYRVVSGDILLFGESLLDKAPEERARLGLFLAFQYPAAIPGVSLSNFLFTAERFLRGEEAPSVVAFRKRLVSELESLGLGAEFASRYVNDGFSGGEKKRAEVVQLKVLRPRVAVLDETDSGLDIDGVRAVGAAVAAMAGPEVGVLMITHYKRILDYVRPHQVHVMVDGRIVLQGGPELADELEARGYGWLEEEEGAALAPGG
jgi:Fe-S cluster assembly ATP-binding protein